MAKGTIIYLLTAEGRKKSLLAGGDGKEVQIIETDITPEFLELAHVDKDGNAKIDLTQRLVIDVKLDNQNSQKWSTFYCPNIAEVYPGIFDCVDDGRHKFSDLQSADALITWEKARREHVTAKKAELQPEFECLKAEYDAIMAEREAQKEKEKAEREANEKERQKRREEEKAAREQEKKDWILAYGSQYLKDCLELDIKANLEYVVERAAFEYPGYTVDYANSAEYEERFSPSRGSIDELKKLRRNGIESEIVWLTAPAKIRDDDESKYYYESREAIIIKNFLGKYNLIKEI